MCYTEQNTALLFRKGRKLCVVSDNIFSCCHPQVPHSSLPIWMKRTVLTVLRMSFVIYKSSTVWAKRWAYSAAYNILLCCVSRTMNVYLHSPGCGQSHGAAGSRGQDKGENLRQTKDLFRWSGQCVHLKGCRHWEEHNAQMVSVHSDPHLILSLQAQFKDVNDADLKAMDCQLSELSAEAQSLTQSCRQLDAGLHCLKHLCLVTCCCHVCRDTFKGGCCLTLREISWLQSWRNSTVPWQQRKWYLRSNNWRQSVVGTESVWRR